MGGHAGTAPTWDLEPHQCEVERAGEAILWVEPALVEVEQVVTEAALGGTIEAAEPEDSVELTL